MVYCGHETNLMRGAAIPVFDRLRRAIANAGANRNLNPYCYTAAHQHIISDGQQHSQPYCHCHTYLHSITHP